MPNANIAVIGLGYVGLPLAVEFAKQYRVTGFDLSASRIETLRLGNDHTHETSAADIARVLSLAETTPWHKGLRLSHRPIDIADANVYIVAVPTPIDKFFRPDLTPLLSATRLIGSVLKRGDTVIYESTVYPGCTEEDCAPLLEKCSGLTFNTDFFCGYSPERINPGDKVNTLVNIKKVTSGSTPETAEFVDSLYRSIITAGTHRAPSIKVAEAAKAVENAQRDINISFMNELALICDRCGIDTGDVIDAASTKWNFLPFRPGLVGGHCISVDPYYLAHRANSLGYNPEVILSGRRVNNSIAKFIADKTLKLLISAGKKVNNSRILVLGITFKENCPDCRNTKVVDIVTELTDFGCSVDVCDPWANPETVQQEYNIALLPQIDPNRHYDAIILCVAHQQFRSINFERYHASGTVIFDVKGIIPRHLADARL